MKEPDGCGQQLLDGKVQVNDGDDRQVMDGTDKQVVDGLGWQIVLWPWIAFW